MITSLTASSNHGKAIVGSSRGRRIVESKLRFGCLGQETWTLHIISPFIRYGASNGTALGRVDWRFEEGGRIN